MPEIPEILKKSHIDGTEERFKYKITDNTEEGLLSAVKEKSEAIFFALEQEIGNWITFESALDSIVPRQLAKKLKSEAEASITRIETSLQKVEDLTRIAKRALNLKTKDSPEKAKLQSYVNKVDANAENWKMKIQDFKDQIKQL